MLPASLVHCNRRNDQGINRLYGRGPFVVNVVRGASAWLACRVWLQPDSSPAEAGHYFARSRIGFVSWSFTQIS
jgi:hypothetical protein